MANWLELTVEFKKIEKEANKVNKQLTWSIFHWSITGKLDLSINTLFCHEYPLTNL